ncbi:MAG: hypothetical protein GY941_15760 [Planctomycetes bacterium]|nr:hypothetical protein [Planctomycetota bacterium]
MAGLIDIDAVKSDTAALTDGPCIGFWVGTVGDMTVITIDRETVTLSNCYRFVPMSKPVTHVKSTGTTATQIVGYV